MTEPHLEATYFASPEEFRRWLKKHHESARELWVGFHKRHTGRPTLTWPESVDEALCFGWIDGIRKSVNAEAYVIRFTPRKPTSIWSSVNIRKATTLVENGRMQPAGLRAFQARDDKKSGVYSFEQQRKEARLSARQLKQFRAKAKAWKFFQAQPAGYQRIAAFYVVSAKREETRERRLSILIAESAAGRRLGLATPPSAKGRA